MAIVNVNQLKPHPKSAELFSDMTGSEWSEFLESVRTSGIIEPLIITPDYFIVSGYQRYRACNELGIEKVDVVVHQYPNEDALIKEMIESNMERRSVRGATDHKFIVMHDEHARVHFSACLGLSAEKKLVASKTSVDDLLSTRVDGEDEFEFLNKIKRLDADSMLLLIHKLELDDFIADRALDYVQNKGASSKRSFDDDSSGEITTQQEENIRRAVKDRIEDLIGTDYKSRTFAAPMFRQQCYRDAVKNAGLGWPYRTTPKKNYELAMGYIKTWIPKCGTLQLLDEAKRRYGVAK